MEDVCMKKVYHAMQMSGGILIGDVNNYTQPANKAALPWTVQAVHRAETEAVLG
jgi:hypothetical protein